MNEFELIERFFTRPPRAPSVRLAVGDDAALLAPTPGCEIVVSVDMLVSGRHFHADTDADHNRYPIATWSTALLGGDG